MRFDLTEEDWPVIERLLLKGDRGPKEAHGRRILNSVLSILRAGAPWRDLPERHGTPTDSLMIDKPARRATAS